MWAIKYGSTLETGSELHAVRCLRDVPAAGSNDALAEIGRSLDAERREIMLRRQLGLTKLYNLVNDPNVHGATPTSPACGRSTSSSTRR